MKVCVVGVGYVGLVTAACLAEAGNHVTCVDTDAQKVQNLTQGIIPIYEPGLEQIVKENIQAGRSASPATGRRPGRAGFGTGRCGQGLVRRLRIVRLAFVR